MRHLVGENVDGYRLRDVMVDFRGSICSTRRFTLVEVTRRELHGAFSTGQLKVLGDHEVWRMVFLVGRMIPRLPEIQGHIIRSWDNKSLYIIWQAQSSYIFMTQVLDARCLPIGYQHEAEMGHRGIPTTNIISQ